MIEFQKFGKIPRLNRDCTITEKIDGTNGAIGILHKPLGWSAQLADEQPDIYITALLEWQWEDNLPDWEYIVYAQSRSRIISPQNDNFGFAKWVHENAASLVLDLGEGLHFGEWWGSGIQRGYGLQKGEKRFSLFNTKRWSVPDNWPWTFVDFVTPNLGVVPVIYEGPFTTRACEFQLNHLHDNGSFAADYDNPEGIVIYHKAAGQYFKATILNDEAPKSQGNG